MRYTKNIRKMEMMWKRFCKLIGIAVIKVTSVVKRNPVVKSNLSGNDEVQLGLLQDAGILNGKMNLPMMRIGRFVLVWKGPSPGAAWQTAWKKYCKNGSTDKFKPRHTLPGLSCLLWRDMVQWTGINLNLYNCFDYECRGGCDRQWAHDNRPFVDALIRRMLWWDI